jgi:hypothetical protein
LSDVLEHRPPSRSEAVALTAPQTASATMTDADTVRFLIEQYQSAYDHQLARSNILLTINTAAIAGAFAWLPNASPGYAWLGILVAAAGILFCIYWVQLNIISQFLLGRYEADPRRIAGENPEIRSAFFISLLFREQMEGVSQNSNDARQSSALLDTERRIAKWIAKTLGRREKMDAIAGED